MAQTGVGAVKQPAQFNFKAGFGTNCGVGVVFNYSASNTGYFILDFGDNSASVGWVNASGSYAAVAGPNTFTSTAGTDATYQATVQNGTITLSINGTVVVIYPRRPRTRSPPSRRVV